mmetsp:Transcript_4676/g.9399  ORF Transcript_4676/g.9399 Transcript_4676/m.9399 type:complete len:98 (+) Transcript_4676:798-1091(+)
MFSPSANGSLTIVPMQSIFSLSNTPSFGSFFFLPVLSDACPALFLCAEMEALTAAAVAGLTVYDMCKAVSKGITISSLRLEEKEGGKSGSWMREEFH